MSEKPTKVYSLTMQMSRRDLLSRPARSAPDRSRQALSPGRQAQRPGALRARRKEVPTGGTDDWALLRIRVHRPFGGILSSNHGERNDVRLAAAVGPQLNLRTALATDEVVNPKEIHCTIVPGREFQTASRLTAADLHYSFQRPSNPPLPGAPRRSASSRDRRREALRRTSTDGPEGTGCPRVRLSRLDALLGDRPEQHVPDAQPGRQRDRHRPVHAQRQLRPGRPSTTSRTRTSGSRAFRTWTGSTTRSSPTSRRRIAALISGELDGATLSTRRAHARRSPGPDGAPRPHRRLPRAADDDQGGQPEAVVGHAVRQAISLAINRQNIINTSTPGSAS